MPIATLTNGIPTDRKIDKFVLPYDPQLSIDSAITFDESVVNYSINQRSQKPTNLICKIVLIGDVAVGKSSLATRLCHNTFDRNYKATIGVDFEVERFSLLGVPLSLQIWDTAGQERFKCIAAAYYRGAHVIVAVFDMNDLETLKSAERWVKEASEITATEHPLVFLVGSKRDLVTDEKTYARSEQTARTFATRLKAEFWPVSSLTGYQIQDFFKRIACVSYQMLVNQQLKPQPSIGKITTKTQLAVDLKSTNGHPSKDQVKSDCCSA